MRKRSSGLSILIAAAVLGYGLIALPPAVSESYDSIYRFNPRLADVYLVAVGALGAGLGLFASIWRLIFTSSESTAVLLGMLLP